MITQRAWAATTGLLVALTAAGCERVPTSLAQSGALRADATNDPAQTVTTRITLPVDFVSQDPCVGEPIHFTGTINIVFHLTNNRGLDPSEGSQIYVDNERVDFSGVGLTSGRSYSVEGAQRFASQAESPTEFFPATVEFVRENVLTSPGLGAIELTTFRIIAVVNATGETVVGDFRFDVRCL